MAAVAIAILKRFFFMVFPSARHVGDIHVGCSYGATCRMDAAE
jgi:hypothetical protein